MSIVMNKLICSFKSDLPNEIDFAMQVATLLANTDNFSWSRDYPLVDAICSSLPVLSCVCNNDTALACDCYPRFWHKILSNGHASNPYLQAATLPNESEQSYFNFMNIRHHELEDHNKILRRIKSAAELIKQFSITCDITLKSEKQINSELDYTSNVQNNYIYQPVKKSKPKSSPPLLKFVSLLIFCEDTTLNLIGLDILSNVASKLSKVPEQTSDLTCTKLVQMFQEHCIGNISCQDGDIYMIIRSIEVVSRLISSSSPRVYSSVVNMINDRKISLRIEQLLTSRNDVNLFLAALEFFYRISRHQPHLLAPKRAQHLIKILVNLLNCEDKQFFTPTALKRIELLDNEEPTSFYQNNMSQPSARPPATTTSTVTAKVPATTTNQTAPVAAKATTPVATTTTATTTTTASTTATATTTTTTTASALASATATASAAAAANATATVTATTTTTTATAPTTTTTTTTTTSSITTPAPQVPKATTQSAPTGAPQAQVQGYGKPPLAANENCSSKTFACEWNDCNLKFSEPKQVFTHVFEVHVGSIQPSELTSCQWTGPKGSGPGCSTKRPKYSLLTHLNDFHCNEASLQRALNRSEPIKPPEHPGYGPNAALMAIRRHSTLEKNGVKSLTHSPLSVSVRLTAALILRNLASQSTEMKQALANHEPLLSEICMTNGRDESKIIAECLSLFTNDA